MHGFSVPSYHLIPPSGRPWLPLAILFPRPQTQVLQGQRMQNSICWSKILAKKAGDRKIWNSKDVLLLHNDVRCRRRFQLHRHWRRHRRRRWCWCRWRQKKKFNLCCRNWILSVSPPKVFWSDFDLERNFIFGTSSRWPRPIWLQFFSIKFRLQFFFVPRQCLLPPVEHNYAWNRLYSHIAYRS